jgi:hypothetical protein
MYAPHGTRAPTCQKAARRRHPAFLKRKNCGVTIHYSLFLTGVIIEIGLWRIKRDREE